jgi:hypothetical protein
MEIPAPLYGTHADVLRRCRKALRRFVREEQPLAEALDAEGIIDTANCPGLIVLEGPSPTISGSIHYQCYVSLRVLRPGTSGSLSPIRQEVKDTIPTALLAQPWSTLCLFDGNNMNHWFPDNTFAYYRQYVRAILAYWDTLDAEGLRYSTGSNTGKCLWDMALTLHQALARLGVPTDLLDQPFSSGRLPAIVEQADPARAGDLIDFATAFEASQASVRRDTSTNASTYVYVAPHSSPPVYLSDQLTAAMRANDADTVRRLMAVGEPLDGLNTDTFETPLMWAVRLGHTDLVRFLLDRGAELEERGEEGESPLMRAASYGHRDIVRLLLDRGADPYFVTDKGWDVVQYAEMGRDASVLAMLKEYWVGKDPDFHRAELDE